MLQLVDDAYEAMAEEPEKQCDAKRQHTRGELFDLAAQLFMQVPKDSEEAEEILGHLTALILHRAELDRQIRAAETDQARSRDKAAVPLHVMLTYAAIEERLRGSGFVGMSSNYAATLVRRGCLGPCHFKA